MNKKWLIIGVTVLLSVIYISVLISVRPKPQTKEDIVVPPKTGSIPVEVSSNLFHFKNDVLGLEFDYPRSWGDVVTLPAYAITNLATVNKQFQNGNGENELKYMIEITFNRNSDTRIKLINDQYPGALFPNGGAYQYGFMDNFSDLVATKNICKYVQSFNQNIYRAKEIYSDCKNGIKEVVVKSGQADSNFENYKFSRYAFMRLSNGYFDNLLLDNYVASAQSHILDQEMTVEEVKTSSKVDPAKLQKDYQDIVALVKSIKTFSPPVTSVPVFQNITAEDPNITLIRKYYYLLATHNLIEAFGLATSNGTSFNTFQGWYKDVYFAKPKDFKQLPNNRYEFIVDYQDDNTLPVKYLVVMEVSDNKIKTISSERLKTDFITYGNMAAVVKERSEQNYIVFTKNGVSTVIDKAKSNFDPTSGADFRSFDKLQFSNTGRYLIIEEVGWESYTLKIFDTLSMKFITLNLSAAWNIDFNADDSRFFTCASNDMSGDYYAKVFDMTNLSMVKDFVTESGFDQSKGTTVECEFNKTSQSANIKISSWDESIPSKSIHWSLK